MHFCDTKGLCEDVDLAEIPRPGGGIITAMAAKSTQRYGLLWPDMDGQHKTTTASEWLKSNKYGCSGILPFITPAVDATK